MLWLVLRLGVALQGLVLMWCCREYEDVEKKSLLEWGGRRIPIFMLCETARLT